MKPLALLLVMVLLNGCVALVAGGAGAGAVAYTKGEYGNRYDKPYDSTWQAALDALHQMGISVYNTSKDGGLIEGTRQDGTKVRLALQSIDANTTQVRIRVGKLGEEDFSRQIDLTIRRLLDVGQPESGGQARS